MHKKTISIDNIWMILRAV